MKIKLFAVASMVMLMASGCSSYRGASQAAVNTGAGAVNTAGAVGGYGAGQVARSGQVARGGFGQQRSGAAVVQNSCAACAASKAQSTYTYKAPVAVKPAPAYKPPVVKAPVQRQASTNNQQYYIDRWNRQQAQQQQAAPRAVQPQQQNYAGYGQNGQSNTTYYDYSSAAKANTQAPASNVASNKSIYTGSYQQKTYAPTTYSGGTAAATTSTAVASSGGSGSYSVKKGDTVFEIMRQTGVYWKDIISLNNLTPPYNISPGQTLRLK